MPVLHSERFRWFLTAIVIALVVLIMLRSTADRPARDAATLLAAPTRTADESAARPSPTPAPRIAVDLIGAVAQPGVYYLHIGARVVDAVTAAGGLAPDADRERINLAQPLVDGQQIRVPRVGDDAPVLAAAAGDTSSATRLIDVNTAGSAELQTLPGIGPVTAQAIIDHRAQIGRFTRIEELEDVKGIGPSTIERLRDLVTVGP